MKILVSIIITAVAWGHHWQPFDARASASRVAAALGRYGYTDTVTESPTCKQALDMITSTLDTMRDGDTLVVHFACHGGIDYFGDDGKAQFPVQYAAMSDGKLSFDDVRRALYTRKNIARVLLIGGCHSGGAAMPDRDMPRGDVGPILIAPHSGIVEMYACSDAEEATAGAWEAAVADTLTDAPQRSWLALGRQVLGIMRARGYRQTPGVAGPLALLRAVPFAR